MRLPEHLDYEERCSEITSGEYSADVYWYPEVFCTLIGCRWAVPAVWSDLDPTEIEVDWNALHPAHGFSFEPVYVNVAALDVLAPLNNPSKEGDDD